MIEFLNLETIAEITAYIVTIASLITNRTNTPKDNGVVKRLYSIIEFLNLESVATLVTTIVTVASGITAMTNTPKDDGIVKFIYSIIEFFALVNDKAKQK